MSDSEEEESESKKLPPMTPPEEAETRLNLHVNDNNTISNKTITVACFLKKLICVFNDAMNCGE